MASRPGSSPRRFWCVRGRLATGCDPSPAPAVAWSCGVSRMPRCPGPAGRLGRWSPAAHRWCGSPASAGPTPFFLHPVWRHSVSMLSTPEVLRRTGGKPVKSIVFDEATIAARVEALGAEITEAYPTGDLLVLGLLKGSFIFLSDLARKIERPIQIDFLVASSYGNGKESSGTVRLLYDPETRLEGKHILLVEDIIDTGKTLRRLLALLGHRNQRSLAVCALLDKQLAPELRPMLSFVGFTVSQALLVGL